ncbi:uncharacterized protein ACRADG_001248 [Cochliomyia hominivorax]
MSLIPFILDLADELHEFSRCLANGIDINDFGFGLYTGMDPHHPQSQQQQNQQQQQQQQQQQPQTSPRRARTSSFSSFWMPSKRHHPYNRIKTACCVKSGEGEGAVTTPEKSDASSSSIGGTPGKSASYSVVNKNGFQVSMNVKQFAPNELSVKTIDNCIVVEGRHDDKEDGHGVISRHFVRKYMLPKGYDPNDVLSTLSSDGILTVKAPPPPPPTAKNDEPNERIIEIQPTSGPTPVLAVSAKDTPLKETTKKLVTAPSARLECQLPEKRQKLDIPPATESQPEESSPPATTHNENNSATAASEAGKESNDVEMEKTDEHVNEIVVVKANEQQQQQQQQKSDVAETDEIDVEKKMEIIEQATEKEEQEKIQEKLNAETEKQLLDENVADSNEDAKNVSEKMDESCSSPPKTDAKEKIEIAETKTEKIKENSSVTKMEIDGDDEGHNDGGGNDDDKNKQTDNTQNVGANKTADIEMKTAVAAAAETDSAKTLTDSEKKTNNTDTSNNKSSNSSNNSSNSTDKTTTNTTILNNNASTNSSSSSTTTTTNNSTSNEISSKEDTKTADNGVVTGEAPEDVSKSNNSDANSAAKTKTDKTETTDSKIECKEETENEIKTAVLNTDTKTTTTTNTTTTITNKKDIADEVALLKAATADPADITDTAEENVILTESIEGITTTATEIETDSNTNTTVENVECSLFAKKTHLGNGNNTTTATPIVATEEMAN